MVSCDQLNFFQVILTNRITLANCSPGDICCEMGLGAILPIHFRKKIQSGDRPCQLKVVYFSLAQAVKTCPLVSLNGWFNFTIEHHASSVHVVPDTLSRAPLPTPSTVGDYLIIPLVVVCSFLITALGYDIPGHTSQLISPVFDKTLHCLALSCDISSPSIIPPFPRYHPLKMIPQSMFHYHVWKFQTFPGSALWPDDLSSLHPLDITRFKFAKLQQDDKWIGPLIQYLVFNNDISVLRWPMQKRSVMGHFHS